METTSADPDRLGDFVDRVPVVRQNLDADRSSVASDLANVIANCDNPVFVPAVASLGDLVADMASDETFVETIRTNLLAADVNADGTATMADARLEVALDAEGVGTPPDALEVEAVTLVGIPPTSGYVDDPICAANGNMLHRETDLIFPAIAGALNIVRTHNSLVADRSGAFGPGWSSVLDMRVEAIGGDATVTLGDGAALPFAKYADAWRSLARRETELHERSVSDASSVAWTVHTDRIRSFDFDRDGELIGWGVGVARVEVVRDGIGTIVALRETVTGRSLSVEWDAGLVASITADDGRTVRYERDSVARIVRARSHAGWVDYEWASDVEAALLTSVVDPDGVRVFTNIYDEEGRVDRQVSQHGRMTEYRYNANGTTVIVGDDDVRQAMVHDRRGNLTAVIDLDGSAMRFTYDRHDRVTKVVERDGAEWSYVFDEHGDLIRRVDPDGAHHQWEWDEAHRIVRETDRSSRTTILEYDTGFQSPNRVTTADGATVSQILDDRGLPTEIVDADGVTTRFEWDGNGQLLTTTDVFGNATALEYDEQDLLVRLVRPDSAAIELERDPSGRVTRTTKGTAVSTYDYTPAGRVRAGTEPGAVAWTATFDSSGSVDSITDAAGATAVFEHDALGNVVAVVAPDGGRYENTYTPVGLHQSTSDPSGATTSKGYDRRGRLVELTDAEGNRWRRQLDVLGRTVESVDPLGGVTRWTYHVTGEVESVTTPDGRTWSFEIDGLGRPTAVIDPAGGRATVDYSPGGRVVRRTSPSGRTETFEYDDAGRLAIVVGIDGERRFVERDGRGFITSVTDGRTRRAFTWDDDYRLLGSSSDDASSTIVRDDAGRAVGAVDPAGVTTQFEYDDAGRLADAVDPAGLRTSYTYDVRGRLAAQTTPGGRTMSFGYGDDGRLESVTDPIGSITNVDRNRNGVVTGQRFGDDAGWDRDVDPLGREIERRTSDGDVLGRFGWDGAGRITEAVVPGSGVFNRFLWDDGGRLAGTETLEGGTTIERDADGWVIATTDERGRRLEYERDGLGRVVRVAIDGEPTIDAPSDDELERDPAGRLAIGSDGTLYRYDDAGRLAEIAPDGVEPTTFTYTVDGLVETEVGPRGRRSFGYDVAGRVVAVTIAGQGTTSIEYDDAGRRSREVEPDGATTTYEWNRSGRLVAIDRVGRRTGRVEITYDALDRPVAVDGIRVGYDPLSGRADRIGDHDFVHLGSARLDLARGEWQRPSDQEPLGGVPVDRVYVVGARVLDPSTRQFLSPDPLLAVVGSNGAASAYTYAWHDPINRVDPSGLRPISVEEADAMRTREELGRVGQFVEAIKEDPWGSLAAVGVVAAGVGLMFVPGGQAIGAGILIGAAMNAGVGFATGTFSPTGMAVSGAFGAIPGGSTFGSAVAIGAASGAGETVVTSVLTGQGFPPPGSIMTSATTGGAFGGGAHVLADLNPSTATANLDHTATPGSGLPEAIQFDGPVVRGSNPNYVDSAWDVGAHNIGQNHRYSGVGRSGVYAGTTTDVVAAELRHYDIAIDDVTVLTRDVQLNSVLDLTDPGARDALGVSLDAITGNDYEVTQAIGDLARSHGYDGILAPSARMDGGTNLVAFDGF